MGRFVVLSSSGRAINLELIAFVTCATRVVYVTFPATFSVEEGPQPLELELKDADAREFLDAFGSIGVNTDAMWKATGLTSARL